MAHDDVKRRDLLKLAGVLALGSVAWGNRIRQRRQRTRSGQPTTPLYYLLKLQVAQHSFLVPGAADRPGGDHRITSSGVYKGMAGPIPFTIRCSIQETRNRDR